MKSPLAERDRERLIEAMLPDVAFDGWSRAALRFAAERVHLSPDEAIALFPRGAPDLVAEFSRWADRRMLGRLEAALLPDGVSARIRLALCTRFEVLDPWREAVRHALSVLTLPPHAALAARLLYETVDAMWYAAGDTATDFSFYTKRAMLAAVHGAATLYWLDDRSDGFTDTRAFIDRRLGDIATVGRASQRFEQAFERLPNPLRMFRPAR